MKEYKMNFATKTLTITKAFAEAALDPKSEASKVIANCRAACPDFRIAYRTHKPSKTSNPAKGMTYDRMERYISAFADGAEALAEFEKVKEFSLSQSNRYKYVHTRRLKAVLICRRNLQSLIQEPLQVCSRPN